MKLALQIGHWNIENITQQGLRTWRSANNLKGSTGATGERDYFWYQVMPILAKKLIEAGIQVFIVDAIYREETYNQDYDLWISLHYDNDTQPAGTGEDRCMISAPNPETQPLYLNPEAQKKAIEFCQLWQKLYPSLTSTTFKNYISEGMKDYYAFDYVWLNTPAVIIEHFNRSSARGQTLLNNPEIVADADFQIICKFFGISNTLPTDTSAEIEALQAQISALNSTVEKLKRLVENIKGIVYGRGYIWEKYRQIKALLGSG